MSKSNEIITEHYVTNYERLVKRSINRVPNRSEALAEECVQEAYARALKYFNTFDPKKDKFEKWFEGVLRNSINDCRNIEKDRGVSKELAEEDGVELIPSRKEKIGALFILAKMKKDINHRVLSLFLLYGYKTKDIAEFTGISHTSVRQIIHRWRNNMYEILNTSK